MDWPSLIVVMGVASSGKTTVGALLAERLQWQFVDGDQFHPEANVDKMRSGIPLSDEDRQPWLHAIAEWMAGSLGTNVRAVVACSALKRSYRRTLTRNCPNLRLVYLRGSETLISQRLTARKDHFFPATLLHNQFEALEEPTPDENPIIVSVEPSPADIVNAIVGALATNRS